MVRRTARKGPNPGQQFWGCTAFPQCIGVINDHAPQTETGTIDPAKATADPTTDEETPQPQQPTPADAHAGAPGLLGGLASDIEREESSRRFTAGVDKLETIVDP